MSLALKCCHSAKALSQQISAQYSSKIAQSNLKAAQLSKTVNLTGKIQYKGKTTIKQTNTTPKRGRKVVGTRSNQNSENYWPMLAI